MGNFNFFIAQDHCRVCAIISCDLEEHSDQICVVMSSSSSSSMEVVSCRSTSPALDGDKPIDSVSIDVWMFNS